MTYARAHLVSSDSPGFYHVYTRCVRRAKLCGRDPITGVCYDHRRGWIQDRLIALSEIFSVDIYSYAVMSNHYHLVLYADPLRVNKWSDAEVVKRWVAIHPPKKDGQIDEELCRIKTTLLLADKERVAILRERLGNLSWYMRYLNENIARRANKEDDCKGRFWEGRFQSQQLLDRNAILTCMVYVELNPVRAGEIVRAETSQYTSYGQFMNSGQNITSQTMVTTVTGQPLKIDLTVANYCELLDWAISRDAARGTKVRPNPCGVDAKQWDRHIIGFSRRRRVIGAFEQLKAYAKKVGCQWVHGVGPESLLKTSV